MDSNRKKTTDFIIKYIEKIIPKGITSKMYISYFDKMSDDDFKNFIQRLKDKKERLILYAPVFDEKTLSTKRNLDIAKELGHSFFKKIWFGENGDVDEYLSPVEYMVIKMPVRRQAQTIVKKIKIPSDNKTIDLLTGQPTGPSKGSGLSLEEIRLMASMGLENSIVEFIKYRGGDLGGYRAFQAILSRYGHANLDTLSNYATGVESTKTLNTFFKAMQLKTNI